MRSWSIILNIFILFYLRKDLTTVEIKKGRDHILDNTPYDYMTILYAHLLEWDTNLSERTTKEIIRT